MTVSFARDQEALQAFAEEIEGSFATPADPVAAAGVVVISVPWEALPLALEQAGSLGGKVVVDTTNHYGSGPAPAGAIGLACT